jgi:hypothetical protein
MATIKYELGKPKKDGSRAVFVLVTHRSARKRIPTGIDVSAEETSTSRKTKEVRIKSPSKLHKIEDLIKRYEDRLFDLNLGLTGQQVDVEYIVSHITSKRKSELDFFEFADSWMRKTDIKGKANYQTMLNSLEHFVGIEKLPFSSITYQFLEGYCISLKGKERAQSMYLGAIRHLYMEARMYYNTDDETIITGNPFERFKVPRQQQKGGRAVDVETMIRIFTFEGGTRRAQQARDCAFLSFCLIGMNSADLYNAKIIKDGVLIYERTKTKDRRSDNAHIEVSVLPVIKPLLKKYKGETHLFNFYQHYTNIKNFNKHLNLGLKQICDALHIDKVQFYQFRHAWATIARNDLGIDKGTVNDALNHIDDSMRVTDIYIKKDFRQINKANKKVVEYVMKRIEQKG